MGTCSNERDSGGPGKRPSPAPLLRDLWQAPAFLLGIFALGLVLWLKPWESFSDLRRAERALAEAFQVLESGDYPRAMDLAERELERAQRPPELAGDLHFVLGSSYLLQAAQFPVPDRAAAYSRGRVHLQQAEHLGVSPAHRPRLAYRLVLAEYRTGGDPERIIPGLERTLELNPADRVEGYALLVDVHLRKAEPDIEAALRANQRLLAQPLLTNPNPVRLQQGELLLRLKRAEQARQVLARIPEEAPEHAAAKHAIALSWFQEEQWQAAAAAWEKLLTAGPERMPGYSEVLYYLGACHAHLGKDMEAVQHWERLDREFPGTEEAGAAVFHLAELLHVSGHDEDAMTHFTKALTSVTLPYQNRLLELQAARQIVEEAWSRWLKAGDHGRARQLGRLYQRLAPAGAAERRYAQASHAAAEVAVSAGEQASGLEAERGLDRARRLFLDAGEAYESAARQREDQPDHCELLWAAADSYLHGQHYSRAAAVLEQYRMMDVPERRQLEAMVALGEAHRALKQPKQAMELLQEALSRPGPLQFRARYLLALTQLDQGKYEEAEANLREILTAPVFDSEPGEIHQSRFTLGYVLYRRQQFLEAASCFEKALEKKTRDAQRLQATYWLAEAYRQAAYQEQLNAKAGGNPSSRDYALRRKQDYLKIALDRFMDLAVELTDRQATRALTREEALLLVESRFGIGRCFADLGKPDEAISRLESIVRDHALRAEGLRACMELTHLYLAQPRVEEAKRALTQAQLTLDQLGDDDLEPTKMTRKQWQEWLDGAGKGLR